MCFVVSTVIEKKIKRTKDIILSRWNILGAFSSCIIFVVSSVTQRKISSGKLSVSILRHSEMPNERIQGQQLLMLGSDFDVRCGEQFQERVEETRTREKACAICKTTGMLPVIPRNRASGVTSFAKMLKW
jgi:hypothetical protein